MRRDPTGLVVVRGSYRKLQTRLSNRPATVGRMRLVGLLPSPRPSKQDLCATGSRSVKKAGKNLADKFWLKV